MMVITFLESVSLREMVEESARPMVLVLDSLSKRINSLF